MTLNELRPGHQRIADIYGLPVNIAFGADRAWVSIALFRP